MGGRWNPCGFQLSCFMVLMLCLEIQECDSLNPEGLALLELRARVDNDPYGAFSSWNPNDTDPCMWLGVKCVDGEVTMLDLRGFSLEGILVPELGKLSHLRSLVLYKNRFSGFIPKEIRGLKMLELLDLRKNNLSGTVPAEIAGMLSLKRLLLCGNKFHGSIPPELGKLNLLSEIQFDQNLTFALTTEKDCTNRKFGHCIWLRSLKQLNKADSFITPIKGTLQRYLDVSPLFKFGKGDIRDDGENCCQNLQRSPEPFIVENVQHAVNIVRRRLLGVSSNLPAEPGSGTNPSQPMSPVTLSSGAFPAVNKHSPPPSNQSPGFPNPDAQSSPTTVQQPSADVSSRRTYVFVVTSVAFILTLFAAMLCICRNRGAKTIGPWKTGLSGQLQKAFVTGVPKLNRSELEAACEDFSNIIDTFAGCSVYKGTLSSGVEIAVASTSVTSSKNWSKKAEKAFRKKIDILSRINHKNFVNLLGYCEEDEPFLRMMVFEYAPNGNLYEHLHVKEVEHLDWNARVRIIMGMAYCLQHMHHELKPPVAHPNLQSNSTFLTDDYAAKIAEISFWMDIAAKSKISDEEESEHSNLHSDPDPEANVYSFGILLLEIISGKVPYTKDQGYLVNWAAEYLNDKRRISYMIDPTLKSFKNNELDIICEVIQECINQDPRQRPTMRETISKLRQVIAISPDAATPKLSPLWWAELEILSVEAS